MVKETRLPDITLTVMWLDEMKPDTGDPHINSVNNRNDTKPLNYEDGVSRLQMEKTIKQQLHSIEDKNNEIIKLKEKLKIIDFRQNL